MTNGLILLALGAIYSLAADNTKAAGERPLLLASQSLLSILFSVVGVAALVWPEAFR